MAIGMAKQPLQYQLMFSHPTPHKLLVIVFTQNQSSVMPVGSEDVKWIDSLKVHGMIDEMTPDVNQFN